MGLTLFSEELSSVSEHCLQNFLMCNICMMSKQIGHAQMVFKRKFTVCGAICEGSQRNLFGCSVELKNKSVSKQKRTVWSKINFHWNVEHFHEIGKDTHNQVQNSFSKFLVRLTTTTKSHRRNPPQKIFLLILALCFARRS